MEENENIENKKRGTSNKTAIIIACICGGVFFLFIICMFVLPLLLVTYSAKKVAPDIKNKAQEIINKAEEEMEKNDETNSLNVKIESEEIEALYNSVKQTPNYIETSLRESDDKVLLALASHSLRGNAKTITTDMVKDLSSDDCLDVLGTDDCKSINDDANDLTSYLDMNKVYSEVKQLFNKDEKDIKLPDASSSYVACYAYSYAKPLNAMVLFNRCGPVFNTKEAIYGYKEQADEIIVLAAYATEVIDFDQEDFEITSNNYKNLKHLRYTFKKNNEGKYYVYDIEHIK